jgi:hypothetical protein
MGLTHRWQAYGVLPLVTRLVVAALAALLLALPAAATASPAQQSMMMDDDLLLYRGDAVRDQTMKRMKDIGVDVVRVTVLWNVVADRARSTPQRRRRFDPRRPNTYPHANWDKYDRLVRAARTLGLGVYFNVTPPAPDWARGKAPRGLRTAVKQAWKPDAGEFAKFVEAVGRRYSGRYKDENDERQPLPRVTIWSLLNEPNQAGWLAPQWEKGRMSSAIQARELYLRGRAALDRVGHGRDQIFFGETAPLGSSQKGQRSPVRPKRWLRAFLCENKRGKGCNMFDKYGKIRATAFAHHPYTKDRSPEQRDKSRDSVTMANIDDLGVLLDRLARSTRNVAKGMPLQLTEFGFETDPPDPFNGVPIARQAEWNVLGEYLAFANPRVQGITQFLLSDVPPVRGKPRSSKSYWFTYQSGLQFANGAPKPSLNAYYMPFLVRSGSAWGQMKFLPDGAQPTVVIQYSPDGVTWSDVTTSGVNQKGFFQVALPPTGPGLLRATIPGVPLTSLPQRV